MGEVSGRIIVDRGDELAVARRRMARLARRCMTDYVRTWFASGVLCDALEMMIRHARGFSDGVRRVCVEMPTQRGKTFHAVSLLTAAIAGQWPKAHVMCCGYGDDFIKNASQQMRLLTDSDGFAEIYPDVRLGDSKIESADIEGQSGQNTSHHVDILKLYGKIWRRTGGFARFRSFRGQNNGYPYDVGILEDPYKDWEAALSPLYNQRLRDFYGGVFRLRQHRAACEVLAFTPWTDNDIREYILDRWEKEGDPYIHLRFPLKQRVDTEDELAKWKQRKAARAGLARFLKVSEEELAIIIAEQGLRPYDRRELGVMLDLERGSQEEADKLEAGSMLRDWLALCQMAPDASHVDRFPRNWWRTYDPNDPDTRPEKMTRTVISLDPNGKDNGKSYACAGVWGLKSTYRPDRKFPWDCYRQDEYRRKPSFSRLCDDMIELCNKWPEVTDLIIEQKAHGISMLESNEFLERLPGRVSVHAEDPGGASKSTRADKAENPIRHGYAFLPTLPSEDGRIDPIWLHDTDGVNEDTDARMGYLTELATFGRAGVDDRVDETSQLFKHVEEWGDWDALTNVWGSR